MTLPVPNLDDRTFDQLATEARSLIPKNFPQWTDHNLSDPGITLLELFAFLLEIAIYQTNRVPERSLEHFAELVGVARQIDPASSKPELIEQTLRRALNGLKLKYRAITEQEFETLAKQAAPNIARAKAVVEMVDTPNVFPDEQFINVIIVPNEPNNPAPLPSDTLRQIVFEFLRPRRPITTRVQVVPPDYTLVRIAVTVVRDFSSRLPQDTVKQRVKQAIEDFLSPVTGGVDRTGWEFGRSVFRSELYQVLESISGVDHVQRLLLNGDEIIGELRLAASTSLVRLDDELIVTVVDT
jgi:Baseplate J-like protein